MKFTMMRHGNKVKHLGRPDDQRRALIRSLVTEVIRHGQIRTTKVRRRAPLSVPLPSPRCLPSCSPGLPSSPQVKAKVIRKYVDHMITLAKNGSLHARRQALSFLYDDSLVINLFTQAPERYKERNGGYCRVKAEPFLRRGDATEMAVIELV